MDEVGHWLMGGRVYYHGDDAPFWETGSKWWSVAATGIIIVDEDDGQLTLRDFRRGRLGTARDAIAGPFDSVESAYAAWSLMNG